MEALRGRPPVGVKLDRLIVVDVECTCWDDPRDQEDQVQEIIEVGLAVVDMRTLSLMESASILVVPTLSEVSEFCTRLTTLEAGMVASLGVEFSKACARLEKYRPKKYPWASWGDFDREAFFRDCARKGVPYPWSRTHFNLKTIAATIMNRPPRSLARVMADLEMEFDGIPHRGIDDAVNTAHVWCRILKAARTGLMESV